ncbi:SRPBCC family protein [Bradyrhizobium centrosematis]|uniref:SRPBCC family protein n=1 Tax=Bradyrhizobium centrosematis TaxID=1300039 RepID=UPI00388F182A
MTKIIETVRVPKQADALWQQIGGFGSVGQWHPVLARLDSEGEHEGCRRTAEAKDGSQQTERLLEMDVRRHFYRYHIESTKMPIRDYVAEFRIKNNGDKTSTVVWSAEFEPTADSAETVGIVRGFLRAGLDNIGTLTARN